MRSMCRGFEVVRICELALCCTKVKDVSHVVIWTACKRTHNQYVEFGPIHGNAYTPAAVLAALVYGPIPIIII